MKANKLYILGLATLLAGGILLGYGIGLIFEKVIEGITIGLGSSMVISGLIIFRTYKRLIVFNKETL